MIDMVPFSPVAAVSMQINYDRVFFGICRDEMRAIKEVTSRVCQLEIVPLYFYILESETLGTKKSLRI